MKRMTNKDYFVIPPNGAINCPGATGTEHRAVECEAPIYTTADPTFMDERDQTMDVNDPYAKGIHSVSQMEITEHWTTPIAEMEIEIGEQLRKQLIQVIANDGSNIFIYPDNDPNAKAIKEFEKISNKLIRDYITEAYGVEDANELDIEARSFGNLQVHGARTFPHYHHGFDGVLIYYLTAGDEYYLNADGWPEDLPDEGVTHLSGDSHYNPRPGHDFASGEVLEGSGNLILCDPRPAINYPYCNKAIAWHPVTGTLLMHPACLWHESNAFTGRGVRLSIVINYRILTETNQETVKPLATIYDEDN